MTGIGEHVRVVPGAVHQIAMRGDHRPAVAVVLRPVKPGFLRLCLDQRPDAARAGGRYGHAELAKRASRQTGTPRYLDPSFAAVGRAEQTASRAAARDVPEVPARLPEGGK